MGVMKRIAVIVGIVVLAAAILFGCRQLFWDSPQQSGWYIQLNVGDPGAKGIVVDEYDVTAMSIEVYGPGEQLLDSIQWDAAGGPQSYSVPVSQAGTHRIEVTHIGENDGDVVEDEESAEFDIAPMVITVVDITPGAIGLIRVEGEPVGPIDLTGYWDFYWTLEGQPEVGPVLFYIQQTDSVLDCSMGFSGTITGSAVTMEAWIDMGDGNPLYMCFDGTVSGSQASGYEITGTASGDFGDGTFRMATPSAAPFGHLDLLGEVEGVPISIDTDYALGSGGELEVQYNYAIGLFTPCVPPGMRFQTASELTVGTYWVTEYDPGEANEIKVVFGNYPDEIEALAGEVAITSYDGSGMAGNFYLELADGSVFSGDFNLIFGTSNVDTFVVGTMDGCVVSEYGVYSDWYFWENTFFEVRYSDHELEVFLWLSTNGAIEVGRTYIMPEEAGLGLRWMQEGQPGLYDIPVDVPGTLTITRFDATGIAGILDLGATLTGSFDVSYWEEWEPED